MRLMLLAVAATIACVSSAQAACNLAQFRASGVTATYDPFEGNFTPAPISVTLRTDSSRACEGARVQFAITYTAVSPQTGSRLTLENAGTTLAASLEGPAGHNHPISSPASAFANDPNSYALGRGGLLSGEPVLALAVKPGQSVPPGNYSAELQILARVTDSQNQISDFSAPLSVAVVVKPSVRLAAGSGGMIIDVGELRPGATGSPVTFDAYSNVDYDLRFISDNGFALVRGGHGGGDDGVPYQPVVSGINVDAGGADGNARTRRVRFDAPSGGGLRHHTFEVKILPFTGARAGEYLDALTIEIRARV